MYPHHVDVDPDSNFHLDTGCGSGFDFFFILMRMQVLLLMKVMLVCDSLSIDPLWLRFEPPRLHCERLGPPRLHVEPPQLLNLDFDANPDPA